MPRWRECSTTHPMLPGQTQTLSGRCPLTTPSMTPNTMISAPSIALDINPVLRVGRATEEHTNEYTVLTHNHKYIHRTFILSKWFLVVKKKTNKKKKPSTFSSEVSFILCCLSQIVVFQRKPYASGGRVPAKADI